jgi:hypothetical protein
MDIEAWSRLSWAIGRARAWAISDSEIRRRLGIELVGNERANVLDELSRRLPAWSPKEQAMVAGLLSEIERTNRKPGKAAQAADRLLDRFVHQLAPESGRPLVDMCLRSPRLLRKRAAWRFLAKHDIDLRTAEVLADQARKDLRPELLRLVVTRHEVTRLVDISSVLARVDEFYWRGRLLQTMVANGDGDAVMPLGGDWPGGSHLRNSPCGSRGSPGGCESAA